MSSSNNLIVDKREPYTGIAVVYLPIGLACAANKLAKMIFAFRQFHRRHAERIVISYRNIPSNHNLSCTDFNSKYSTGPSLETVCTDMSICMKCTRIN